jgi:hypothetical protein
MNKKLRLLFLSLLAVLTSVVTYAGDTYTISFNGKNEQSTDGYFSWNKDKHNFNSNLMVLSMQVLSLQVV